MKIINIQFNSGSYRVALFIYSKKFTYLIERVHKPNAFVTRDSFTNKELICLI